MSFRESMEKQFSGVPQESFSVLGETTQFSIRSLPLAIVFIHARWSASSIRAIRALARALAELDLRNLSLVVIDTDGVDERFFKELQVDPSRSPINGHGETFWIRDGRIIARLEKYDASDLPTIREKTLALLRGDQSQ